MKSLIFFLITVAFSIGANASERNEALCSKVKECVLSEAFPGEVSDELQAFVIQTVDAQCATMLKRYDAEFKENGLQDQSNACVDSIIEQPCSELMASKGEATTQSCKDFETAAEAAGVELK